MGIDSNTAMDMKVIIIDDNVKDLIKLLLSANDFKKYFKRSNEKNGNPKIQSRYSYKDEHSVHIDFYNFPNDENFSLATNDIINLVKQNKYDLIFLDHNLSAYPHSKAEGLDRGKSLLEEMNICISEIPVIMISSKASLSDLKNGLPCAEYLDVRDGQLTEKLLSLCKKDYMNDIEYYYINNISIKLCPKNGKAKTILPIELHYDVFKNAIYLKGTLKPLRMRYITALKVYILRYYSKPINYKIRKEDEKSYLDLLLKKYKLDLNNQQSPIKKIVIKISSKEKELTKIELGHLLACGQKPGYLDLFKNFKYLSFSKITV